MKKTVRRIALFCALMFALLPLAGCLKVGLDDPNTTDSADVSVSAKPYLYESMNYSYKTDVSSVLSSITTGMSPSYLLLVNKQKPVTAASDLTSPTYSLESGTVITRYAAKSGMQLEARALRALYAMIEEMRAEGITDIQIQSAYRDEAYQQTLFNNYLLKEQSTITADAKAYFGEAYIAANYTDQGYSKLTPEDARKVANFYSAFPGQSEHHTGLCVDLATSTEILTNEFANTPAGQWLLQNCYRFGFILRYPEGKTDITGYCYEPWHYRFVGREAATEIMLRGLTLEEFLG